MQEYKKIFFEEMGTIYKAKREEMGFSVEFVMDELKLSRELVYAMENATTEKFPDAVYIKGFYRAYGKLLGVDKDIIDAFINTAFIDTSMENAKINSLNMPMKNKNKEKTNFFDSNENIKTSIQYKKWGIILCIILGICILIYILFSSDEKKEVEETQSIENTLPEQNTETIVPTQNTVDINKENTVKEEKADTKTTTNTAKAIENTASISKQERSKKTTEKVVAPQDPPAVSEKQTDATDSIELPKKNVKFVAIDVVWLEVKHNGKVKDFILQPEVTRSIEFSGPMEIKIGDASALEIMFGDEVMKDLGKKGQVRNITINNG